MFTLSGKQKGIPRGVPNVLMTRDNRTKQFDIRSLPSPDQAVQMYKASGDLQIPVVLVMTLLHLIQTNAASAISVSQRNTILF